MPITHKSFPFYLLFWLIVCSIAAGPSFFFGLLDKHNIPAMTIGVLVFVVIYAVINHSDSYTDFVTKRPLLHKALHVGFGLRIFMSLATILVMVLPFLQPVILVDFLGGVLSLKASQYVFGEGPQREFVPTLFTTVTQGTILSAVTILICLVLWGLLAVHANLFRKPAESVA